MLEPWPLAAGFGNHLFLPWLLLLLPQQFLTPCWIGLAVEDEVVDSNKATPASRRYADQP
jgi:hypothetical protein